MEAPGEAACSGVELARTDDASASSVRPSCKLIVGDEDAVPPHDFATLRAKVDLRSLTKDSTYRYVLTAEYIGSAILTVVFQLIFCTCFLWFALDHLRASRRGATDCSSNRGNSSDVHNESFDYAVCLPYDDPVMAGLKLYAQDTYGNMHGGSFSPLSFIGTIVSVSPPFCMIIHKDVAIASIAADPLPTSPGKPRVSYMAFNFLLRIFICEMYFGHILMFYSTLSSGAGTLFEAVLASTMLFFVAGFDEKFSSIDLSASFSAIATSFPTLSKLLHDHRDHILRYIFCRIISMLSPIVCAILLIVPMVAFDSWVA